MIKIQVPATSANIGPGFDSLGLALNFYNRVWIEEYEGIKISTRDGTVVPTGEDNLVYRGAKLLYDLCGRTFCGLRIEQENNIPITKGLGSSSACIVSGLMGANELLGGPLSRDDLINLAATLEGHPDNTTPAILGGLVASVLEGNKVYCVKVPISGRIKFAVFVPDFELKTEFARAVLPTEVQHRDAVFNLSRSALMIASLFSGRLDNIRFAVQDRLHQPYRLKFIPKADEIFDISYRLGALGTYISGAGPALISMIRVTDIDFLNKAQQAVEERCPGWQVMQFDCDENGTSVEKDAT
jgi:homoserine kinase